MTQQIDHCSLRLHIYRQRVSLPQGHRQKYVIPRCSARKIEKQNKRRQRQDRKQRITNKTKKSQILISLADGPCKMSEFWLFIYAYLLGGFTLLPFCLVAAYYFLQWYLPKVPEVNQLVKLEEDQLQHENDDLSPFSDEKLRKEYLGIKVTEIEEKETSGVNTFRSGWLTVTTEYYEFPQNSSNEKNNEPENNKSAYTTLYKLVRKKSTKTSNKSTDNDNEDDDGGLNDDNSDNKTSNSSGNVSSSNQKRRKNKYFAVLRHRNLFLYKDEEQTDVLHVIVLSNHIVSLWPRDLPDGQLFSKMSAICILKKDISKLNVNGDGRLPPPPPKDSALSIDYEALNKPISTLDVLKNGEIPPKQASFYIYADSNYEKEDWYFDLIKATKKESTIRTGSEKDLLDATVFAKTFHPKTADVISLIQNLHSSEGQLHTRWFNAILGRVFLALYGTDEFENYIKNKLLSKLQKINKPGFLDEFKIEKVFTGKNAPLLTSPKLNKLTPEGDLEVEASIFYNGGISFQVSTKVNINLGTRFKPGDISILLAVTVKQLHGDVIFQVKRPPTERIWWGFKSMPFIDIAVEPVVSARQITTGMITRTIENKLKESVKESLVLPAMDDITFFSTKDEIFRGGIWDKSGRPEIITENQSTKGDSEAFSADNSNTILPDKQESTKFEVYHGDRLRSQSFASSLKSSEEERIAGDELSNQIDNGINNNDTGSQFLSDLKSSSASIFSFKKDNKEKTNTNSLSTLKRSLSKNPVVTPKLKKSDSTVKVSSDQFLADGSFIRNDQEVLNSEDPNAISTGNDVEHEESTRRSASGSINSNAADNDKITPNSTKKMGKWYFDKKENESKSYEGSKFEARNVPTEISLNGGSPLKFNIESSPKAYKPPEMISSRRAPRNKNRERSPSEVSQEIKEPLKENSLNQKPLSPSPSLIGGLGASKAPSATGTQQPYGKIPEMAFPSTHSPAQFISLNKPIIQADSGVPALPPRSNTIGSKKSYPQRRPPPKSGGANDEETPLL